MQTMARETWTDERMDDLAKRVDDGFVQVDRHFAQVDRRFDQVRVELRADIKASADGLGERFDGVGERLDKVDDRLEKLEDRLHAMYRLLVAASLGALGTLFAATLTAIVALITYLA